MIDRLDKMEERYNEINTLLMEPDISQNIKRMTELSKEHSSLTPVIMLYTEYKKALQNIIDLKEMMHEDDPEIVEMAKMEYDEVRHLVPKIEEK